ncbi:MAG: SDR family NAD(P)-dependent oxidoreductase, partial [Oscillospiraceae bacterium]|nr:SDR family NAD(P)-dependent oxidoreductase [Oscillospiraceae bacterium]
MNFLISGAASGIGKATAEYIAEKGHTVYAVDLAAAPQREGIHSFVADITDETALIKIRDSLLEKGIKMDVIANIAGIHMMASLVESDYSRMKRLVDVNLEGTMLFNRVFHPCLGEKGRIIIVTSEVADFDPMPFNGLYNVTKTALESY